MKFRPMLELIRPAFEQGYAVPSFCVWNAEAMVTVLSVAAELRAPVILMNGPAEFGWLTPTDLGAIARALAGRFNVTAALLLDHGDTPERVRECLDAGYTSVMLDYSARPYAENAGALRQVVGLAHPRGVTVEGEIGHVGKADTATAEGGAASTLTEPASAAAFAAETGVDALAVSIGNAHGQYTRLPKFDFERLAAIHAAAPIPLVLHGGTGTPADDLKRAISLGIAKVNVATDLVAAMRETLRSEWDSGRNLWTPLALARAYKAIIPVAAKWIELTGAAGRAT